MLRSRIARVRVRRNRVRYVLIIPRWVLLTVVMRGMFKEVTAFGPTFSNHVWSIVWLAIAWPKIRPSFGMSR